MAIEIITREEAEAEGVAEEQILLEQSPGHYPEFRAFIAQALKAAGGDLYFRAPSGSVFRLGPIATDNPDALEGIEICVRLRESEQTIVADEIDADLWSLMEWIVQGVGGDWTLEDLRTTGAIYRAPGAPDKV